MSIDYSKISHQKADLLKEFIKLSKGKTMDDMLPLMLAFQSKAKENKITFSKEEIIFLSEDIKSDMSEADKARVDMLIKMISM